MRDYLVYRQAGPEERRWGCAVTSAGHTRITPGSPYPPHQHPLDHHFGRGGRRILQALQLVFITEGSGFFEADDFQRVRIRPGLLFLLFPGVWHRYAPDVETGWVEHWVELRGRTVDQSLKAGYLSATRPVLRASHREDVALAFDRLHAVAAGQKPGDADVLATLGLHLLALAGHAEEGADEERTVLHAAIQRAQRLIAEQCHEPLRIEALARQLGIPYGTFRRSFRLATGTGPKQYHLAARLQRAQDLLANTGKSIKEVADILNFDSPFHLTRQFRQRVGLSPSVWRARFRAES